MLKTLVFSLTGVAPDRQKIMVKGGVLKDDTDLSKLALKENQQLMMMGTVGELLKEPAERAVFVEDMSDAEISKALKLPAGLVNLGNTCYLASTVQCLRAIPELGEAIKKWAAGRLTSRSGLAISSDQFANFAISMNTLFDELSTSGSPVHPIMFVQVTAWRMTLGAAHAVSSVCRAGQERLYAAGCRGML
ncbi:Ubiquitin carboxyl-terminal hydrolase 14 [Kappamyces sp. JEL0680]|nr:Ubiquitin carboxyl-terminal hydrolase 14 [Kappamyces sp. JEL0680]